MSLILGIAMVFVYLFVGGVVGYAVGFARGTHRGFVLGRMAGLRMMRDALMGLGVVVGILETSKGQLAGLTVDRVIAPERVRGNG